MWAEGAEPPPDAAALPRPTLQTQATPGSHTSCHVCPTLALAEESGGPDAKKGQPAVGPAGAPTTRPCRVRWPPGSPPGEAWGRRLCWEGLLSPVAGPTLRPSYPEAPRVPLPAQCRRSKAPGEHGQRPPPPRPLPGPSGTAHTGPAPGRGTLSLPGQPLPRPLPWLLLGMPWEALPASAGTGPRVTGLHHPATPPLGREIWGTQALGAPSLSEGPARSRGPGGRRQARGCSQRPLPAGPRPGQGLTAVSRLCPQSCLMPRLKQTKVRHWSLLSRSQPTHSKWRGPASSSPTPGPGQTGSPLHSIPLQDSRSHWASCRGSQVLPTGLGSRSPAGAHGSETRPWETLTPHPCLSLAEPGMQMTPPLWQKAKRN